MDWNVFLNKNVFVQLTTGAVYKGDLIEIYDEGDGLIFMTLIDKFDKHITFTTKEILKIVEED